MDRRIEIVTNAYRPTLAERVVNYINATDPFGDFFSEHDVYEIERMQLATHYAMEAIIASGGRVAIPADRLHDPRPAFETTTRRNAADDTFIFEVKRR